MIKSFTELFEPKPQAEKDFVAKHPVKLTPDVEKNGDEVFKGSKVKTFKRKANRFGSEPKLDANGDDSDNDQKKSPKLPIQAIGEQWGVVDGTKGKVISKHADENSAMVAARVTDLAHYHKTKTFGRYSPINLPNYIGKPEKPKPVKKSVKEEVEIQELSKKTLGSYIKGASRDAKTQGENDEFYKGLSKENPDSSEHFYKKADDSFSKGRKRIKGIDKAVSKLTKEELLIKIAETAIQYAADDESTLEDFNEAFNELFSVIND